jgi:biopolymer transport protein TolQ
MEATRVGNSLSQLILNSDSMTWVVLISLLLMSIACWTILIYKIILLRVKRRQMRQMMQSLHDIQSFEQMRLLALSFTHTAPGYFMQQSIHFLRSLLEARTGARSLHQRELELLQQHVDQQLDDVVRTEEHYLPFLSMTAAVSPLLGLFGTVWGLVHAFVDISQKQSADIVTVAPGIAEALITTLAGLVVAIPALMMYHYLSGQGRALEHQYIKLADRIHWVVQKHFAAGE